MIPEGFATVYAFLGLVAPGLLFEMLRERRRPALEQSSFREASRVALMSLVFTTASILILMVVALVLPGALPDLAAWVGDGDAYARDHFWRIVVGITAEVVIACLLALGADRYLRRGDTAAHPIGHGDLWNSLFSADLSRDEVAWVKVELTSGAQYWGYVDYFTIGKPPSEREMVLKGPRMQSREAGAITPSEEEYWAYVVVKYADVRLLKVRYEPRAKASAPPP